MLFSTLPMSQYDSMGNKKTLYLQYPMKGDEL